MKKEIERKWKIFGECAKCGSDAEVFTKSKKKNWVYDEEEARCTKCGLKGTVSVEDSECADIVWDENLEEYQ